MGVSDNILFRSAFFRVHHVFVQEMSVCEIHLYNSFKK